MGHTPPTEEALEAFPPALQRPFRLIAFDWDGTAVRDRQEDAGLVSQTLGQLLQQGILIAVITGTHRENVHRQFSSRLPVATRRHLSLLTNRGSEVFGFDAQGESVLLQSRQATAEENHQLDAIAEATQAEIQARTHPPVPLEIRYNRLNRRKLDLLPGWVDPPKEQIPQLLDAVQRTLLAAGLTEGLRGAYDIAQSMARRFGLPEARITTDVKHLEIGLTDKGDSARWILQHLAPAHGIPPEAIAFGGDEFGPLAGIPGSDYRMVVSPRCVYFSVGKEPQGVPADVLFLGGGPARFRQWLALQSHLGEVEG